MHDDSRITTFLFTDIEGSTRLWEQQPERMRTALAYHDAVVRSTVQAHGGEVVKMTGDGVHAAFADPMSALLATVQLQMAMLDSEERFGVPLRVRCGLHAGPSERRDNDFFGAVVNRAARIMSAAHGGQMLVSDAVAGHLRGHLPDGVRLRDLGAVRLRDLSHPEKLFQLVHPRLREEFPSLRSLEETPNNLPHHLASFIGRERELAATREMLAANRLVTVIGMGGMGKTRLALQAAAEMAERFPDGVWLAELAPLRDPGRVAMSVAAVMGVAEEARLPVMEALLRHVKQREMLLVLDNCEHVLDACAELARALLTGSPKMRILASSREPLQLTGEATLPLSALPIPDVRALQEPAAVVGYASVQLFVERARAVSPDFSVDRENAAAVAAICHRLDGIPLALELAAARVRSMPVRQIAERLRDRFRLLSSSDATLLPRQRTLQALIDWSYDLLTQAERRLLRELSVFAGGWTVEAAEAVCGDSPSPGETVLELLGRLVDRSLVMMQPATGRYHLLETVRQYAQRKLDEEGAADELGRRHFDFHLQLAEEARAGLVGPEQARWLARLDLELENLLAAHEWAGRAAGRALPGLALVSALKFYWINRGLLELGHRVTVEALRRPEAGAMDSARCRGLFNAGQLSYVMGRFAEARGFLDESLRIARHLANERAIAAVLQPLGMSALGEGDLAAAHAYLDEAVRRARARTDRRELAAALNALAQLLRVEGALARAGPLYDEVLEIARELGDRESEAIVQLNRAMVALASGCREAARVDLEAALALAEPLGSSRIDHCLLEACGALAAIEGEWGRAAQFFHAGEACARETGLQRDPADDAFLAPLVARTRENLGGAAYAKAVEATTPRAELLGAARAWIGH